MSIVKDNRHEMHGRLTTILSTIVIGCAVSTPATAATLYDVNNGATTTTRTQSGWIAATTANNVTFTAVGGSSVAFRDRALGNTDGTGADTTHADMWGDFAFASNTDGTGSRGMNISISGLLVSMNYNVRIWAFDDSTGTVPVWSWNGSTTQTFPNSPDPESLNNYVVSFTATTNSSGVLVLQGRSTKAVPNNVFVNGFELEAVPEPSTALLSALGILLLMRRRR